MRLLFIVHFVFWWLTGFSQVITLDSIKRIMLPESDEINPSWSADGRYLIFQSNQHGQWDIYIYDFSLDSLQNITLSNSDETDPVFFPHSNTNISFVLKKEEFTVLYKMDILSSTKKPLFNRDIYALSPSFSPSGRLVVFKGYDHNTENWQVFTYDFIYDNLNKLTNYKHHEIFSPQFSPDGRAILFGLKDKRYPYPESLIEISWYGKKQQEIDSVSANNFCWTANAFRIICSENRKPGSNQLLSIRKDGSKSFTLTKNRYPKASPAVSSDGTKMAVAIKTDGNYDIVIFKLR